MTEAFRHHVDFVVTDFGDEPTVVTEVMGVLPSKAWALGEPGKTGGRHTHGRWVLQSRLSLSDPVEAHFEDLLEQLAARASAVREVARRFDARILLAAYWQHFNPSFQLSNDALRRVAELGLYLDFDLYFLGPDDD